MKLPVSCRIWIEKSMVSSSWAGLLLCCHHQRLCGRNKYCKWYWCPINLAQKASFHPKQILELQIFNNDYPCFKWESEGKWFWELNTCFGSTRSLTSQNRWWLSHLPAPAVRECGSGAGVRAGCLLVTEVPPPRRHGPGYCGHTAMTGTRVISRFWCGEDVILNIITYIWIYRYIW